MAKKIYTRTGDKGTTALFGGSKVPKDDVLIEAYGTVDELNAYLGLLVEELKPLGVEIERIQVIQHRLFDIGAYLAVHPDKRADFAMPLPSDDDIRELERAIDAMEEALPPLKSFILPGGNRPASMAHVCRTVCRRAERRIVTAIRAHPIDGQTTLLPFLNRLSDYLFVLARYVVHLRGDVEVLWQKP